MSKPLIKQDTIFFQRLMKVAGLYPFSVDGSWGPKTQKASDDFDVEFRRIRALYEEFDSRSEGVIATLLPVAQDAVRRFLSIVKAEYKNDVRLLSGTLTYAEQNALFAKRPVVTKAKGGQSNHNFGIAWDIGIFERGNYLTGKNKKETDEYRKVAAIVKREFEKEIEWGGDWKSFTDLPHYQLRTGKSTSEIRVALESGKAYV
jgi:peptidoglycan L-alanyl-D-glutamate endopeptidase CwlK